MTDPRSPDHVAGIERQLAAVRELATRRDFPPLEGWHGAVADAVLDLEWILARYRRWPDAADRAVQVVGSLLRMFVTGDHAEAIYLDTARGGPPAGNPVEVLRP